MPNAGEVQIPDEAPPPYSAGPSSNAASSSSYHPNHLDVPGSSNGSSIPPEVRRSMEDERRPLPEGWVRTLDPETQHQFFVDTTKDPPRSVWVHPYDDDEYLHSLSGEERERIEQESLGRGHPPSKADIMASHTDDEASDDDDDSHHPHASSSSSSSSRPQQDLPPRPDPNRSFGRKLKDKVTGSTHDERVQDRKRRAAAEQKMYEQHIAMRRAMLKASQTGQPQKIGQDSKGRDIYVEPPAYRGGYGGYGGGVGYDPYGSGGVYSTPSARYARPAMPYGRRPGYGYGGGYGMPMGLGLGLGGGLLGGALLGGAMMDGGMGMGGGGM